MFVAENSTVAFQTCFTMIKWNTYLNHKERLPGKPVRVECMVVSKAFTTCWRHGYCYQPLAPFRLLYLPQHEHSNLPESRE
jgi:hypothetical protein